MSKVAVVGAGTMGNGIAHVFAQYGWDVSLVDLEPEALERALKKIATNIERLARKGVGSLDSGAGTLARIKPSTSFAAVKGAEILVEAATENFKIKSEIFATVSRLLAPDSILASNTSSISITELAKHANNPARVIGMHFMNPVPLMPLVEVVRGQETGDGSIARVVEIAKELGKTPVVVHDAPGFVSNRVLMPMINEAILCVQEGIATAEAVDQVMTLGMKHPLGPLALADLIGLDVCLAILEVMVEGFANPKYRPARLLKEMVASGRLGRKSGVGFYVYRD